MQLEARRSGCRAGDPPDDRRSTAGDPPDDRRSTADDRANTPDEPAKELWLDHACAIIDGAQRRRPVPALGAVEPVLRMC
jgi:hypothetical protein